MLRPPFKANISSKQPKTDHSPKVTNRNQKIYRKPWSISYDERGSGEDGDSLEDGENVSYTLIN